MPTRWTLDHDNLQVRLPVSATRVLPVLFMIAVPLLAAGVGGSWRGPVGAFSAYGITLAIALASSRQWRVHLTCDQRTLVLDWQLFGIRVAGRRVSLLDLRRVWCDDRGRVWFEPHLGPVDAFHLPPLSIPRDELDDLVALLEAARAAAETHRGDAPDARTRQVNRLLRETR